MNSINKKALIILSIIYIWVSFIIGFTHSAFGYHPNKDLIDVTIEFGLLRALPVFLLYFPIHFFVKKSLKVTLWGIFIIFVLPVIYILKN